MPEYGVTLFTPPPLLLCSFAPPLPSPSSTTLCHICSCSSYHQESCFLLPSIPIRQGWVWRGEEEGEEGEEEGEEEEEEEEEERFGGGTSQLCRLAACRQRTCGNTGATRGGGRLDF